MKKKVIISLLVLGLFGCNKKEEVLVEEKNWSFSNNYEVVEYDNFTDLGNNVIFYKQEENNFEEANQYLNNEFDGSKQMNCTSFANVNSNGEVIIGRNNDSEITEYPVIMYETTYGKYKTFNIYYSGDGNQTYDEIIEEKHLDDNTRLLTSLYAQDVLNEEGLYIETNMRYAGADGISNSGTNPGKTRVNTLSIPSLVGQNCKTVKEAVEYLNNSYDYYTLSSTKIAWLDGWDAGFLIGDATGEYGVIEIANNKVVYTPYQNVNANYYIAEEFKEYDVNSCGLGRASIIKDQISNVENVDDAISLIEKASWYHEILDIEYSYKDKDGVHFVDKDGNISYDYRDEAPTEFLVDEKGNLVSETGYDDDYELFIYYTYIGEDEKALEYKDGYDKQNEYYDRSTSEYLRNDIRFEDVKKAYLDMFGDSKYLLEEYFNGNYKPLMEDGNVYTTGIRTGVNCKQKYIKIQIFEREDLIFEYSFK